jgi:NAD(P)-dependent dehydrogenase (short-subunit alcohol dehydrogenase family)
MGGRLDGLSVLVTGGGSGIGRGVAQTFAREGASLVVNDLGTSPFGEGSDDSRAKGVVDEIVAGGGIAVDDAGDISDPVAAKAMIDKAVERYGKLDVVVNLAGTTRLCTILDATDDDLDSQLSTHVRGYFNTTRYAAAHWAQGGGYGRIINFSSGAGHWLAPPSVLSYATAKAGVIGLTRAAANALAAYGVTANCISPGSYGTGMSQAVIKDADLADAEGMSSDPVHIAPIVVFLASAAAGHVSGRVFEAFAGRYALYTEPTEERVTNVDFLTDPDGLYAALENQVCAGLSLSDLPYPTTKLPDTWREDYGLLVPKLEFADAE